MSGSAIPILTAVLMLAGSASGEERRVPWCGVEHVAYGWGATAHRAAQSTGEAGFEDEVDLSGRTAVVDVLFVYSRRTGESWGGCTINGHYWVFGSAATDRGYKVVVFGWNGKTNRYTRGKDNPLIADTTAFRCEP